MTKTLYLQSGAIVVDSSSRPILCDACPCSIAVCTGCSWLRSFDVQIYNVADDGCGDCEGGNVTVGVSYIGTQASADFGGTTWHVWRSADSIWPSGVCSDSLADKRLTIYAQYVPAVFQCIAYGMVYSNSTDEPINVSIWDQPGFAIQVARTGFTCSDDPFVMSLGIAKNDGQCQFGGLDMMTFSPFA